MACSIGYKACVVDKLLFFYFCEYSVRNALFINNLQSGILHENANEK